MSDEQPDTKRLSDSSGTDAESYDRGRPAYPADAVTWLLAGEAKVVLELGAGTGTLTREMVDQGHAVFATDKDPAMLDLLRQRVPEVSAKVAEAEDIPANARSVDVVVAAQAFHCFDHDRALTEIARVLRPGGHVALVWSRFDERIPWVRKLVRAMGEDVATSPQEALADSDLFGEVESQKFACWQDITRDTLVDIALSRPDIATLPEDERETRLEAVRALYDDYGRGHDGMQLPHVVECFRAQVVDRRNDASEVATDERSDASQERPMISDGTDTDMLLIDFR